MHIKVRNLVKRVSIYQVVCGDWLQGIVVSEMFPKPTQLTSYLTSPPHPPPTSTRIYDPTWEEPLEEFLLGRENWANTKLLPMRLEGVGGLQNTTQGRLVWLWRLGLDGPGLLLRVLLGLGLLQYCGGVGEERTSRS